MAEPRRTPPAAEGGEGTREVNMRAVLNGTPQRTAVHELARSQKHECRVQFGTANVRDSQYAGSR